MKKIDASKWKEFLIGDLFDIHPKLIKKLTLNFLKKMVRTQLL